MEGFKNFWNQYKGAIIGIVVAILILCTKLYDLIIGCVVIILGAMVGSYVQKNKDIVKEKYKNLEGRMLEEKSSIKIMKRSAIREAAFKLIYSFEIQEPENLEEQIDLYLECEEITDKEAKEYIIDAINGIKQHTDEINNLIKKNLKADWTLERISKVDFSILKLAIYEIKYKELPYKVAINEALEISKKYGEETSRNFINGILASVVKEQIAE